jgi:hypothetical protein
MKVSNSGLKVSDSDMKVRDLSTSKIRESDEKSTIPSDDRKMPAFKFPIEASKLEEMLTANEELDINPVLKSTINLHPTSIPMNISVNPTNQPDTVLEDMSIYTSANCKTTSAGYQSTPKGFGVSDLHFGAKIPTSMRGTPCTSMSRSRSQGYVSFGQRTECWVAFFIELRKIGMEFSSLSLT